MRLLQTRGWDVVMVKRHHQAEANDPLYRTVQRTLEEAAASRKAGYRKVVLAGQSFGGWVTLDAIDTSRDIDAAVAFSGHPRQARDPVPAAGRDERLQRARRRRERTVRAALGSLPRRLPGGAEPPGRTLHLSRSGRRRQLAAGPRAAVPTAGPAPEFRGRGLELARARQSLDEIRCRGVRRRRQGRRHPSGPLQRVEGDPQAGRRGPDHLDVVRWLALGGGSARARARRCLRRAASRRATVLLGACAAVAEAPGCSWCLGTVRFF